MQIPAYGQAGVIQTNYDIVKTHGVEIKGETLSNFRKAKEGEESESIIHLPI